MQLRTISRWRTGHLLSYCHRARVPASSTFLYTLPCTSTLEIVGARVTTRQYLGVDGKSNLAPGFSTWTCSNVRWFAVRAHSGYSQVSPSTIINPTCRHSDETNAEEIV